MKIKFSLIFVLSFALLIGCKKSGEPTTTGIVSGTIKDASTSAVIQNVRVLLFDANTPAANSIFTGGNGSYSFDITPGSYYIKLSKLGYENLPPVFCNNIKRAIRTTYLHLQLSFKCDFSYCGSSINSLF
jgi:Carboxypeptidase regulatory-like domain